MACKVHLALILYVSFPFYGVGYEAFLHRMVDPKVGVSLCGLQFCHLKVTPTSE